MGVMLQKHVGGKPPPLPARVKGDKPLSSRSALRPRRRAIMRVPFPEKLPPHSPALPTGMLNTDLSKLPGGDAFKNMGPLGNMMSSMGLGDDDESTETPEAPAPKQPPVLGRRQRKRVVRVGR